MKGRVESEKKMELNKLLGKNNNKDKEMKKIFFMKIK